MRIAILLCFLIGISCVTAQQATIQSQLSTNQTLAIHWSCNFPYATATDDQGVLYSSCTGNNGSTGILWTYLDNKGLVQTGSVTSPGNGSCFQSWGLSVSHDGGYVFATCYGNPQGMQIMGYERQMNGSMWSYQPKPLNTSNWACGRDIIYDSMTEDIYAICGTSLIQTSTSPTRIIRFPHNGTTDSYMSPEDLNITANYIKYNPLNNYLYFATTTNLGYLVIHNDDGTAIDMPNNMTMIPVDGTLTYYCEITSFTWMHNSSNTLFVGCTGVHNLLTQYSSYSILRIDMNMTWVNMTTTTNSTTNSTTMGNSTGTNSNSTGTNSSMNSNTTTTTTTTSVLTWTFTAMNISSTDSKAQGVDGNQDVSSYPADGSCKGPSDMEVDSMKQLYVTCMQNQDARSVIRYTQINSTYYLPAYVTSPTPCSHPQSNSLTLTSQDAVIVSCYISNIVLEFTTPNSNITVTPRSSSSSSSTGITGNGTTNGTSSSGSSSTGGTSMTSSPTPITGFNGSSSSSSINLSSSSISSSTGGFFPNGTTSSFSSSSSSIVCRNGTCTIGSSSTGLSNGSNMIHVDVMVFLVSLLLLVVSV